MTNGKNASSAVKSLGEDRVGGYLVVWGSPDQKDLTGDYFTPESELGLDWYKSRPALYHHGLDQDVQTEVVGRVDTIKTDENGVWVEAQLNKRSRWARTVKRLVDRGALNWSSGSIQHLVERERDGHLKRWPIVEASLTPAPAEPRLTDVTTVKAAFKSIGHDFELPEDSPEGSSDPDSVSVTKNMDDGNEEEESKGGFQMGEKLTDEQLNQVADVVGKTLDARDEARREEEERQEEIEAKAQEEAKAILEKYGIDPDSDEPTKRLPRGNESAGPRISGVRDRRYDGMTAADLATVGMVVNEAHKAGIAAEPFSDRGREALATKMFEAAEGKAHALPYDNRDAYQVGAVKALADEEGLPIKADEVQQSDLSNFGDEWVAVAYGSNLWESIRINTFLLPKMPTVEVPAGHESIYLPLESGDPTWYLVNQVADEAASGWPNATVTSSQMGTDRQQLTLKKIGARTIWSGEMSEDSIIPFASQLRRQFEVSGQEVLEALLINGDTATGATTNINDIGGTPSGSEYFLAFDGFRKLALVTNTANSRDGGALASNDFLETVKLMGNAGKNALDRSKVEFIVDPLLHYQALELPEVKTKDVAVSPTIEDGRLTGLYGYRINISGQIAWRDGDMQSNSAGKVDLDTTSNNSFSQILAVRYDQWKVAFRRRMTMETTRIARADATELVAMVRLGMINRDNEAAAISYGIEA